jgi:hypothetical protein
MAAQDFLANCGPQINRLEASFFSSLGINVTNSVFLANASSLVAANTCRTVNYTFNFNQYHFILEWKH